MVNANNPLQSLLYRLLQSCPKETTAALKEELQALKEAGYIGEYKMPLEDEELALKADKTAKLMIDRWSLMVTGKPFEEARKEANHK